MLTEKDKALLAAKGISEAQLQSQLQAFKTGFPYLKIAAAASTERGIFVPTEEMQAHYDALWQAYIDNGAHRVVKFVPASGAASRMFKDLFAFVDGEAEAPAEGPVKACFEQIEKLACYDDLNAACTTLYGQDVAALVAAGRYKNVLQALLKSEGLNYGGLPKGLLKFHKYDNGARTPMEEHLVEGAQYACGSNRHVAVHFTVSSEHMDLFKSLVAEKIGALEAALGVTYDLSFSVQKPSTDTVALADNGTPFRDDNGEMLFRPGGHGALIENLGDIDADVIFIKNIDNVVHDAYKADTVTYKRLLAGLLIETQQQIFRYLERLDSGSYTMDDLLEMLQFVQKHLCCKNPETKMLEDTELAIYLRRKLNRPVRVCGMVKNVGEPGGGPFLAYNPDGTISPQILESSQIDANDAATKAIFDAGTHFNPVDLVCATKDYQGRPFDLPKYVDPATGFIASKSKNGRTLKALELPGLWNGAMSDWNTIFVEVPLSTFNPVKTVNDLFRKQHLG